jgi:uncharacterized membrane protein
MKTKKIAGYLFAIISLTSIFGILIFVVGWITFLTAIVISGIIILIGSLCLTLIDSE